MRELLEILSGGDDIKADIGERETPNGQRAMGLIRQAALLCGECCDHGTGDERAQNYFPNESAGG